MKKLFYLNKFLKENSEILLKFKQEEIEESLLLLIKEFGNTFNLSRFKKFLEGDNLDNLNYRFKELEKLKSSGITLQKFILLYGEISGTEKWNNYRLKIAMTKENMIKKHGEILGIEKWNNYCEKQAYTNSMEYKQMNEKEFKEYNKSRAVTKENMIKKHGEILGIEKWNNYCERQAYTNSMEYFIKKYGVKKGRKKWKTVNSQKALTLNNFIRKYGD